MSRSAFLIFNPIAGQGDPDEELAIIKQHLEPEFELEIAQTTPEKGSAQLARQAKAQNAECVIVAGGDGTISAVVTVLAKTKIPIGLIPRGTANAFVEALHLPQDIAAACDAIAEGHTREVDLGCCNDNYITLFASIGFGAEMVERADRDLKNKLGVLAYFAAGIQNWLTLERFEFEIETDNRIITGEASAVAIANAAPNFSVLAQGPAQIVWDDGLLDITLIAPKNRASALMASFYLLKSALRDVEADSRQDIGYFQSRWAKITTNPPQKVVIDGELAGKTPIEVLCVPKALTVFVPRAFTSLEASGNIEHLEGLSKFTVQDK